MLQHDFFKRITQTVLVPVSLVPLRLLRSLYSITGFLPLAIITFLLFVSASFTVAQPTPNIGSQQARQADSVVDMVGVNTHFNYGGTPYVDHFNDIALPRLLELGVRHIRDGNNANAFNFYQQLAQNGIKLLLGQDFRYGANINTSALNNVKALQALSSHPVEMLEGPNEYDCSGDSNWEITLGQKTKDIWNLYKGDSVTASIPLAGPSYCSGSGPSRFSAKNPGIGKYTDINNFHQYTGGVYPEGPSGGGSGQSLLSVIAPALAVKSGAPLYAGEIGFTNDLTGALQPGVSERAAGKYLPRQILLHLSKGLFRDYIYQLLPAQENFNLINADGTPKAQFYSLKNFIEIFKDPGASFSPGTLNYSFSGDMSNVYTMLFQKRDGTFLLALWQGVTSFDRQDVEPQPHKVTLQLGNPVAKANMYLPLNSASPFSTIQNASTIDLSVPDHVLVVELTPQTSATSPVQGTTVRIEAGGDRDYTAGDGTVWKADQYSDGGGIVNRGSIAISGTSDPLLYQTERYCLNGYNIPVSNGWYNVTLGFAETYSGVTAAGQRVFDATVQNTTISNLDIFSETGGRNIALQKKALVQVADGTLHIKLAAKVGCTEINSIAVLPTT